MAKYKYIERDIKDELPSNNLLKIIPTIRKTKNETKDQENTESDDLSLICFFTNFKKMFINR
jgi:hypothetical protein